MAEQLNAFENVIYISNEKLSVFSKYQRILWASARLPKRLLYCDDAGQSTQEVRYDMK